MVSSQFAGSGTPGAHANSAYCGYDLRPILHACMYYDPRTRSLRSSNNDLRPILHAMISDQRGLNTCQCMYCDPRTHSLRSSNNDFRPILSYYHGIMIADRYYVSVTEQLHATRTDM